MTLKVSGRLATARLVAAISSWELDAAAPRRTRVSAQRVPAGLFVVAENLQAAQGADEVVGRALVESAALDEFGERPRTLLGDQISAG